MKYFYAAGKRKSAVARVRLYENGSGKVTINDRPMSEYFSVSKQSEDALAPLRLVGALKNYDVTVKVTGGGVIGQAQAVRHGVARALERADANLRQTLKRAGYLSRDDRQKERKKPGLKSARRAPQFSKR